MVHVSNGVDPGKDSEYKDLYNHALDWGIKISNNLRAKLIKDDY